MKTNQTNQTNPNQPQPNTTMQLITGNTYPVKEEIKALGGTWKPKLKGWMVPDDKAEEARALVENAPASAPRRRHRRGRSVSHAATFSSGHTVHTNRNGRCEDAPCCGCCS